MKIQSLKMNCPVPSKTEAEHICRQSPKGVARHKRRRSDEQRKSTHQARTARQATDVVRPDDRTRAKATTRPWGGRPRPHVSPPPKYHHRTLTHAILRHSGNGDIWRILRAIGAVRPADSMRTPRRFDEDANEVPGHGRT